MSITYCFKWYWTVCLSNGIQMRSFAHMFYEMHLADKCLIWKITVRKLVKCCRWNIQQSAQCLSVDTTQILRLPISAYNAILIFSLPIAPMMIVRICALLVIIIISEVWPTCHCLGLGHETMVCSICLSVFLLKKWARSHQTSRYFEC